MPPDPISRSAAKEAMNQCFWDGFDYPYESARIVAKGAIDSLPAAEADGRWETLRKWLPVVAEDWDRAGMPQKKFAVAYIIDKMDQIDAVLAPPSPPAAEGAQRQYDEHGQPICNYCNAKTNRAYAKHVKLQCWKCGNYLPELDSGPAAQLRGEG